MPYPLLSGRVGQLSQKGAGAPVFVAVVVLASVLGGLYIVTRAPKEDTAARPAPVAQTPPAVVTPAPDAPSADLTFHMMNIRGQLLASTEQIDRAQRLVGGLVPDLAREGLWLERRRAEAAVVACETARQ